MISTVIFISVSTICLGTPYVRVNPERIKGIVLTNKFDSSKGFKEPDEASFKIANHILDFILHEVEHGSEFFLSFIHSFISLILRFSFFSKEFPKACFHFNPVLEMLLMQY